VETRNAVQGGNTRSVLTNFDIFGDRLQLQLSPFYYYRQLDDSFFAVALEYPVGNATINFFYWPESLFYSSHLFLIFLYYILFYRADKSIFLDRFPDLIIALC